MAIIALIALILGGLWLLRRPRYDRRGFDKNGVHRNGTKYDDDGFDFRGLDAKGFNRLGYDVRGYDRDGFDKNGYNSKGKNRLGQYDRLHDPRFGEDGFADPGWCPVGVTNHARERMVERQVVSDPRDADRFAREAFSRGKSKRQLKKTSAMLVEDIESRSENSVVLIYRGFVCIFSKDNQLITVYKNDRIPL